jgi:hypothetical protein
MSFSEDENIVRKCVAENPNTNRDLLAVLAEDSDETIRKRALINLERKKKES